MMGFIPDKVLLCRALAIFRGTEPISALTHALFTLLHSLFVSGDLALTEL